MRYFIDTEFNGFRGELISLAVVGENGRSAYYVFPCGHPDAWVAEHVMPILFDCPKPAITMPRALAAFHLAQFIAAGTPNALGYPETAPVFIADWPDDIRHLCDLLVIGPGSMVATPDSIGFEVRRVDAYPTALPGAVQHNAWWDAMALRLLLTGRSDRPAEMVSAA